MYRGLIHIYQYIIYNINHYASVHNLSPVQNSIGRNNGQIILCDQCLLNMSAGLSFQFMNMKSTYIDTIAY